MRLSCFYYFILALALASHGEAAIVHFYKNPRVPQAFFHVALEFQGGLYEADPHLGGRRLELPLESRPGDVQVEISDSLVNKQVLENELGKDFDFDFVWDNNKTYCSKLVGKALNMLPQPMDFSGTHYALAKPEWLKRQDLGLSPEQIYEFALKNSVEDSLELY